jgi:hypothetical protein
MGEGDRGTERGAGPGAGRGRGRRGRGLGGGRTEVGELFADDEAKGSGADGVAWDEGRERGARRERRRDFRNLGGRASGRLGRGRTRGKPRRRTSRKSGRGRGTGRLDWVLAGLHVLPEEHSDLDEAAGASKWTIEEGKGSRKDVDTRHRQNKKFKPRNLPKIHKNPS